jgi:hypothetical protein
LCLLIDSCQSMWIHSRCIRLVYLRTGVAGVATYKVNISLPEDLVSEIDEVAGELGLSRSGFVAEASVRYVADVKNLTAEQQRRKDVQRAIDGFKRVRESLPPDFEFDFVAQIRKDRDRDKPEGWAK